RSFDRGWIGLGVNGLDRKPSAHYAVFIRPVGGWIAGPDPRIVKFDAAHVRSWRATIARAATTAASDAWKPFKKLPHELIDAIVCQAAHDARHSTLLASGRVWKTHAVSDVRPDQVVITYGSDSASALVWTWRTSPEIASAFLRI